MVNEVSWYSQRTYREGDEIELARLFNEVYSKYAGFVSRTIEYWRWCCLNRPTVEKKGICVIERSGEIVGYSAVEINPTKPRVQANVLEFCYKPSEGEEVARRLVKWILEYAKSRSVDSVSLDAPIDDEVLRKIVKELEFDEFSHVQPLMKIISFPQLVQEILTSRNPLPESVNETFYVDILDAPLGDNSFSVQVRNGAAKVNSGKAGTVTITVNTDVFSFTSCMFGKSNVLKAILTGKLRAHPFWKFRKAVKLFSALKLSDPWFIPAGDFG